jgi:hypothetical protein
MVDYAQAFNGAPFRLDASDLDPPYIMAWDV